MTTMSFVERLQRSQLMVAVRTDTPEKALKAAKACIEGGVRFVEVTFSVPGADEVIRELKNDKRAEIGAGTVLSIGDLKKAITSGASYIVSPHLDEEIVKFTKKEGVTSIPGACTPTEIYHAHKAGGDIIKLFPFVEIGGLDFLRAIRGPLPHIKYMLCGGVTFENVSDYIAVRPAGILVGSAIIKPKLVEAEDWPSITELARRLVRKVDEEIRPA